MTTHHSKVGACASNGNVNPSTRYPVCGLLAKPRENGLLDMPRPHISIQNLQAWLVHALQEVHTEGRVG